jgi:hypothetical protein
VEGEEFSTKKKMKLTKQQLKQIIKEELKTLVNETGAGANPVLEQVERLIEAIEASGPADPENEGDWEALMGTYPRLLKAIYDSGFRISSLIPWDVE